MSEAVQDQGTMSLREHLIELRTRIVRSSIAVIAAFFVAWAFRIELYDWLSQPIRDAMANNNLFAIKALQITESIEVYMKLSLVGGLFLASPWVFYQIWAFVAPGLLAKEKRLIVPILSGSVACFVTGAAFCYLVVLPFMTDFLIRMTTEAPGLTLEPTLASTVSFATLMLVAFGAVFELPLFMYVLAAVGLVSAKGFLGFYRYWIVIAFIIGAVLTPTPDPINQTLMSAPLVLLYGVGIGIAWFVQRDPDAKFSRRSMAMVALVLVGVAVGGVALAARRSDPTTQDDLPVSAQQIVGVHMAQLPRLLQQAERDPFAARLLSPLTQLRALALDKPRDPVVVLVRTREGAALLLEFEDAESQVRRLAKLRQSSAISAPSGLTTLLSVPGAKARWRAVAAGPHVLWIGDDGAVDVLARVRTKQLPALADDPVAVQGLRELRAGSPLWSLSLEPKGFSRWLPAGALQQNVKQVAVVYQPDPPSMQVRLDCKGPDAASALRDRLDAWVADQRHELQAAPADDRQRRTAENLSEIAVLLARTSEAAARLVPVGSVDHQTLMASSAQAMRLARELSPTTAPATAPAPEADAALGAAVRPPALVQAEAAGTSVTWKLQADSAPLLAMLAAPADAGLQNLPKPSLSPAQPVTVVPPVLAPRP